jgi:hypothetical protein
MPNTTSASLKLTVQATGENSGTWGQITNTNLLILEQAIGGYDAVVKCDHWSNFSLYRWCIIQW